jgi:Helix-turn-helix domain
MSWHATAWVKDLRARPDGAALSRGQKLLLFVLADYHNTAQKLAWPSVLTLAAESLLSVSQTKRDLSYLEDHCVIQRCRPERYGKGHLTGYAFLALDDPAMLAQLLAKRVHHEPFSIPHEKGSKGVQKGTTYIEEQRGNKERLNKNR